LFYENGYHATTVDHIIQASGVSKPTVYSHFPTKEDLCVAYLQRRRENEVGVLNKELHLASSPRERFLVIIKFIRKRMIATKYRGCGFFNMVSELADISNPIVKEARVFVDGFNQAIYEVVNELKASNKKYSKIDAKLTAQKYYLIICGAIMAAQELQTTWPLDIAVKQVEELIT
jgi:AcrR family transcriptional regulator